MLNFNEWLASVDVLADAEGARCSDGRSYTEMTGRECWREAYDDGVTPQAAWSEEKLAGIS